MLRHMVDRQIQRSLIIACHDIGMVMIALPVAVMLRENRLLDPQRMWEIAAMLPAMAAAAILAAFLLAPHRALWRRLSSAEIVGIVRFVGVALILFCAIQFLIDRLEALPRSAPAIQFLVALFGLLGSRIAYERYRSRQLRRPAPPPGEQVLVVGAGDGAALVIELLRTHPHAGEAVGILADDVAGGRHLGSAPVLGGLDRFDAALAQLRVQGLQPSRIVVTRPHHDIGRDRLYRLMEHADALGMRVDQLPEFVQRVASATGAGRLDDTVGGHPNVPEPTSEAAFKRLFDVAFAAVVLTLCSPLLAVAAAAVAVGVQRPILFTQMRPGLRGRPYRLIKLRTMRDPVDADGRVLTDDERTPWVGRLLRRTRLDELPQVWNVLMGDMSLIGPRPLLASDLDAMPDGGRTRSAVRPGVTGWAQVNGGHQLTPDEKLALDLWYAANADLKLDLLILWRTLLMVLFGERREPSAIADARASLATDHMALAK